MPTARPNLARTASLFAVAAAAVAVGLCGCAGLRLTGEAPPGVDLGGTWKLDTLLSTDTRAALAGIVPRHRAEREPEEGGLGPMQRGGASGGGNFGGLQTGPPLGAGQFAMPVDTTLQRSLLSGGDYLQIEQRPGELIVSNGGTTHEYVAGERSVVSIPEGAAERWAGWKGKEFRIEIRPATGPSATVRFRLDDRKRLVETIDVASDGQVRRLSVTRVYERTNAVPTLLPAEN